LLYELCRTFELYRVRAVFTAKAPPEKFMRHEQMP
jgi:hypothetical protein